MTATLDRVAPYVVAAAILGAAAGSSIQRDVFDAGRPLRWLFLGALVAFGLVRGGLELRRWRSRPLAVLALAAFCGLALASIAWSVNIHGSFTRAVGITATVVGFAALGAATATSPRLAWRLLDGVLIAAAVVAVAGFVYWLVSPSSATIPATTEYGTRYQGIEQNPDTAPLLLAFGAPVALAGAARAHGRRRAVLLVVLAVLVASIVASGSRGGMLGAFVGAVAVAGVAPLPVRRRVALTAAALAVLVAGAGITTLPNALPAAAGAPAAQPSRDAETVLPLAGEIGNPWWTRRSGDSKRALFNTSVRVRALRGTLDRVAGRPLLGYGFGTDQWAFVNRYYAYASENPENGYAGILLQLGAIGLAVFLCALAVLVVPGVRAVLRRPEWAGAAGVGTALAGLALGFSQSYFHGPGGIGAVPFWLAIVLVAAVPLRLAA